MGTRPRRSSFHQCAFGVDKELWNKFYETTKKKYIRVPASSTWTAEGCRENTRTKRTTLGREHRNLDLRLETSGNTCSRVVDISLFLSGRGEFASISHWIFIRRRGSVVGQMAVSKGDVPCVLYKICICNIMRRADSGCRRSVQV